MQQQLSKIIYTLSAICILLFVFSCSDETKSNKDHLVFRYNEHNNISSLDPAFARNHKTYGLPINYLTGWFNWMIL